MSKHRTLLHKTCAVCSAAICVRKEVKTCGAACAVTLQRRTRRAALDYPGRECGECGNIFCPVSPRSLAQFSTAARVYCSPPCQSKMSSKVMAATNRRFASARMKEHNPMTKPEVRQRVSETLRAIGHRPRIRGGNGRGLTVPQGTLLTALGDGWFPEFVVGTGSRGAGIPSAFRIDIANPEAKIAVEIDGPSHSALRVRAADHRKDAFLLSLGWRVFRFSNREATERTSACVDLLSACSTSKSSRTTTTLRAVS